MSEASERYSNVTLRLNPEVHSLLKQKAAKERVPLYELITEAVLAYLKWLRKAELEESKNKKAGLLELSELEKNDEEFITVSQFLDACATAMEKGKRKRRNKK